MSPALPETLHAAFAAACARAGALPFLAESACSGGRVWSFAQAELEIDALADAYAAAGWGLGHRVALGMGNHPRHFFHFLALNRLGASIVPLNPDHRGAEIRHALRLSCADLVVALPERAGVVTQALEQSEAEGAALRALPVVTLDARDAADLAGAARPAARAEAAETDPKADAAPPGSTGSAAALLRALLPRATPSPRVSDAATPWQREVAILFTSGTSGPPKGCVLTNEYVLTAGAWYRDLGGELTLHPAQERLLNPLPVFHMNCGMTTVATMCLTDNCLVLPDRFHVSTWWEDCVRSRATAVHYLGIMPPALFKQAPSDWESRHTVRFGLGAGCDPSLHPQVEARFGFPFVEVWGMTETGRFLANQHEPRLTHTRAFGREAEPLEVRVIDDADRDLPDGSAGELLVRARGPDPRQGFFSGYLDDDEATQRAWRGGWFHTGDVVTRDASGMLYFVDRRKDMIRRSGENISAGEVEAVLAAHPAVARVAVLAVPDEMRDEEVLAVVVPAAGHAADEATARALALHCRAELAYYKAPAWVAFRAELPVTATNKLQKNRIFAPGEDARAGAFDLRALKTRPATR
jgi:crotonobetaine/carnitine-CoA ligase